jgi:transposase
MTHLGYSQRMIAQYLDITRRTVLYTQHVYQATPKKSKGRPPKLSNEQMDEIIEFISASKQNRRMGYNQVIEILHLNVSKQTLRLALNRQGYHRYIALRKPPISEATKLKRLRFAHEHIYWTPSQWAQILFTDETWVNGTNHRKIYVTRRSGEELDPTYIRERIQRPKGWMFWGSIAGFQKGAYCFWEKGWGKINSASY